MKFSLPILCITMLSACGSSHHPTPYIGQEETVPGLHRVDDSQCETPPVAGNITCGESCPTDSRFACSEDKDCTAGQNGRCVGVGGPAGSQCTYDGCANDANCPTGQLCACHGSAYMGPIGNTCVPGNCRVDADCGERGYCSPSSTVAQCGMSVTGYYCHTASDECVNNIDCGTGNLCAYDSAKAIWACAGQAFVCL